MWIEHRKCGVGELTDEFAVEVEKSARVYLSYL